MFLIEINCLFSSFFSVFFFSFAKSACIRAFRVFKYKQANKKPLLDNPQPEIALKRFLGSSNRLFLVVI